MRRAKVALGDGRLDARRGRGERLDQRPLRLVRGQAGVERSRGAVGAPGETVRAVESDIGALELLRGGFRGQRPGEVRHGSQLGDAAGAGGPHELDRHVEDALEALEDKVGHVGGVVLHVGLLLHEEAEVALHQRTDVDLEPALDRDPAEADRRPPKAVRVTGAGRPLAEREGDGEVVDLLCGRQHAPGLGLRDRPVRRVGQVLLLDRRAHALREPREARVLGADVPLEVGELADELRGLVGLGQPSGLARDVAAPLLGDQRLEPSRLVREAARAGDERDRAQLAGKLLDPLADVAFEREVRVCEPSFEDTLVAGDDHLGIAAVGHEGEPRAFEREVALMRLHRCLDHPGRKLEEALVEAPGEDDGALDEEDDLLEHAGGVAPAADRVEPVEDLAAALALLRLDARGAQHLDVLVRPRHLHLAPGEAVAVREMPGFEPRDPDLQGRLVELRAQPAHRPARSAGRPFPRSSTCRTPGPPRSRRASPEAPPRSAAQGRRRRGTRREPRDPARRRRACGRSRPRPAPAGAPAAPAPSDRARARRPRSRPAPAGAAR